MLTKMELLTNIDNEVRQIKQTTTRSIEVKIRKNFNETAFFFPDLRTDSTALLNFLSPCRSIDQMEIQALAHTKDAAFGYSTKEIITQKQLMVQPNAPRFLREGDKMEFSAKIVNLTEKELTGTAELQLFDALPINRWMAGSTIWCPINISP